MFLLFSVRRTINRSTLDWPSNIPSVCVRQYITVTAQNLTKLLIHSKGPEIQHKPTETLDKNTPQTRYIFNPQIQTLIRNPTHSLKDKTCMHNRGWEREHAKKNTPKGPCHRYLSKDGNLRMKGWRERKRRLWENNREERRSSRFAWRVAEELLISRRAEQLDSLMGVQNGAWRAYPFLRFMP
jgi:hypothetical protein